MTARGGRPLHPKCPSECPFDVDPNVAVSVDDKILIGDKAARGLRLHLTVRDALTVGGTVVAIVVGWYSVGAKLDALTTHLDQHLSDERRHPDVLARQDLIDSRIDVKNAVTVERLRSIEDKLDDLADQLRRESIAATARGRAK